MPLLSALVLWALGMSEFFILFATVMASLPCAAIVTMLGELYDISPGYAVELVGASTLFSPITIIPLVTFASFLAQHPLASLIA